MPKTKIFENGEARALNGTRIGPDSGRPARMTILSGQFQTPVNAGNTGQLKAHSPACSIAGNPSGKPVAANPPPAAISPIHQTIHDQTNHLEEPTCIPATNGRNPSMKKYIL